jgi:hypothetical protein
MGKLQLVLGLETLVYDAENRRLMLHCTGMSVGATMPEEYLVMEASVSG